MGLKNDLEKLQEQGVIDAGIAARISAYYAQQKKPAGSRLLIAFSFLGALLVGSGILLIIAHNWDQLSKLSKTLLAFVPLLAGQGLAAYGLFGQKLSSITWRESSAILLILGLGACLALISQIYQLPGDLGGFLLTWVALALPVILLLHSSMASLLCLAGATWYACATGYWDQPSHLPYWFPLLIAPSIWHYLRLMRSAPLSNFTLYHHIMVPLALFIVLGTIAGEEGDLLFLTYMLMAGIIYLCGRWMRTRESSSPALNPYQALGSLAMVTILLLLSFHWFWEDYTQYNLWSSREGLVTLGLFIIYAVLLWRSKVKLVWTLLPQWELTPSLFTPVFLLGSGDPWWPRIAINLLLLAIGIATLIEGDQRDRLQELNYGLLIITALLISRFFDLDISFVARGLMFVAIGLGFFMINYRMIKKRKT